MRIGIYGIADGELSDVLIRDARDIGVELAIQNKDDVKIELVTGACTGLPDLVVRAVKDKDPNIFVEGFSPYASEIEHITAGGYPHIKYNSIRYTGEGGEGRNVDSVHSCNAAIFVSGDLNTIKYFTEAYRHNGVGVAVLVDGIKFLRATKQIVGLETEWLRTKRKNVIYETDPETLVKRVINEVKEYERQNNNSA